jgi:hypothetical protein
MKKKFINGILMVALVAATSTSFVSCKDNDTDVDLIGQIGNVRSGLQTKIDDLNTRITTVKGELENLVGEEATARKQEVERLERESGELETRLTELNTQTKEALEKDINKLDNDVTAVEAWLDDVLNHLVTSIENVATYSPMLGQIVLPGATPNIVAAYFGEAAVKGSFPASDINITEVTPVKWSAGATLGEGEKGYAGTVYLTINKYANNLDGINFTLVNTAGEEAPVELNIEASDKVIYAGYTRAAAENNFYEANATISSIDDVKVNLNLPTLKADIKQIWNDRNRKTGTSASALAQLAADLYTTQIKENKFPVYGVRASWSDSKKTIDEKGNVVDGTAVKHFVTSKPEIVVAAVKPLSYDFDLNQLPGQTYKTEGIEAIEKLYNKIIDKVVAKFPTINVNDITITINPTTGNVVNVMFGGAVIGTADLDATIVSLITKINTDLGTTTTDINTMLAQVQELNNLKAQVAGTKETFANYLNRVVNKFEKLFTNNLNRALQPTLLAIQSDNTINRVSGIKTNPLVCGANTELFPTSYSVEYFAPAYKKFVVVTEIDGKKATAADNETLGENLGVILESGNNQKVTISPAAGKTYTVVYSAVDYQGVVRTNTYYVTGK